MKDQYVYWVHFFNKLLHFSIKNLKHNLYKLFIQYPLQHTHIQTKPRSETQYHFDISFWAVQKKNTTNVWCAKPLLSFWGLFPLLNSDLTYSGIFSNKYAFFWFFLKKDFLPISSSPSVRMLPIHLNAQSCCTYTNVKKCFFPRKTVLQRGRNGFKVCRFPFKVATDMFIYLPPQNPSQLATSHIPIQSPTIWKKYIYTKKHTR